MYQGLASGRAREVADALSALAAVGEQGPEKALSATLAHPIALAGVIVCSRPAGPVRSRKLGQPGGVGRLASSSASSCSGATTTPLLQRDLLRPCRFPLPTCELHHVHSARQFYYRAPVPVSSSDTNQPQLAAISKEEHKSWEN